MGKMKNKILLITMVISLLLILWFTRIIPSGVCVLHAVNYVNDKYPGRDFKYSFVEYSPAHEKYFVHFVDKDQKTLNIMASIFGVSYDPLDPPG